MAPSQSTYRTEVQVFVFMTLHYPSADNAEALAHGMAEMRGWMESHPGCLGVEPPLLTEDGTCLVGFSSLAGNPRKRSSQPASTSTPWVRPPAANFDRGNRTSSPPHPTGPPEDCWLGRRAGRAAAQ